MLRPLVSRSFAINNAYLSSPVIQRSAIVISRMICLKVRHLQYIFLFSFFVFNSFLLTPPSGVLCEKRKLKTEKLQKRKRSSNGGGGGKSWLEGVTDDLTENKQPFSVSSILRKTSVLHVVLSKSFVVRTILLCVSIT